MEAVYIAALATIVAALVGAGASVAVALITTRSQTRKAVETATTRVANDAERALDAVKGIPEEILQGALGAESSPRMPASTEAIDPAKMEALTQFVLTYKTKTEVLELLGCAIHAGYYYSFAVYYAFIQRDFLTAQYYIERAQDAAEGDNNIDPVPILRWAARISRLNRNEQTACVLITKIVDLLEDPAFQFRDRYDPRYCATLWRSRGFTYFNRDKYSSAIADFQSSLRTADPASDQKLPYCELGIAMCLVRSNSRRGGADDAAILDHYTRACEMEPRFAAATMEELTLNLRVLEDEKRYYFSELEKSTIVAVWALSRWAQDSA